jgi:hypothetical protein
VGVDGDKSRGRSLMRIACCHVVGIRVLPWFPAVPEENTAARRKRHGIVGVGICTSRNEERSSEDHGTSYN